MKLLAIADSPTVNTGFACVVRNLLQHWQPLFERIDVWGINYNGYPHEYPYRIYPAGVPWNGVQNLQRMCEFIRDGDYSHLWILQDTFQLVENNLPKVLWDLCQKKGIAILLYYPVDAPLEKEWLECVRFSDTAVAYTEYGRQETLRLGVLPPDKLVHVIPHGVDAKVYYPMEEEKRKALRAHYFPKWETGTILINVNRNERRKAMVHSLQVLRQLKADGDYKLYLHCNPRNVPEGLDLFQIGNQLGLKYGVDWVAAAEEDFKRGVGEFTQEQTCELYNASDICISTTLGEGWGLSITEAAACGLQVVAPHHTALPYIAEIIGSRVHLAPCIDTAIVNPADNARIRFPVEIVTMASIIAASAEPHKNIRVPLPKDVIDQLDWEHIAKQWTEFF